MNQELKDLNKKIRFLNDAIVLHELFKPATQQNTATAIYQARQLELAMNRHGVKLPLTLDRIRYLEQFRFFGAKTAEIKRTVKADKLVSIYVTEEQTNATFPFSVQSFEEMINKISLI